VAPERKADEETIKVWDLDQVFGASSASNAGKGD
jgi:hypothetical protein